MYFHIYPLKVVAQSTLIMWLAFLKQLRRSSRKQIVQNHGIYQKSMHQSKAPCVTQKLRLREELKRRALNIPQQRSAHKSAMESDRSLMRGEPVSSRQCGPICVSTRKASDREQPHHSDTSNTSNRTCPHKVHCCFRCIEWNYF